MITNITKHLGILWKLKFNLNRSSLEKMYLVYIRPVFKYSCEVWDNIGIGYSDKLENLQLEAARIVTGLPILTKFIAYKVNLSLTGFVFKKEAFCMHCFAVNYPY
jgi:hypothetical protein